MREACKMFSRYQAFFKMITCSDLKHLTPINALFSCNAMNAPKSVTVKPKGGPYL